MLYNVIKILCLVVAFILIVFSDYLFALLYLYFNFFIAANIFKEYVFIESKESKTLKSLKVNLYLSSVCFLLIFIDCQLFSLRKYDSYIYFYSQEDKVVHYNLKSEVNVLFYYIVLMITGTNNLSLKLTAKKFIYK